MELTAQPTASEVDMGKSTDKAAKEIIRLHEVIEHQKREIRRLAAELENMNYQATGYEAVVDFLWHKLQER